MTDADQHTAFLQAICEAPKDDAPRLMFADWLDEHGEPERAEFIRVGCELAKPCPLGYSDAWHVDGCCPFCDPLKERERELLSEYWEQWSSAVENYYGRVCFNLAGRRLRRDSERWVGVLFRRGFVAAVALPVDAWLQHADALCAACPLEEVTLADKKPYHNAAAKWIWSRFGVFRDVHVAHTLVSGLFELLAGGRDPMTRNSVRYYDTEGQANADLSRACIAYGREKAGLPPLEDRR